MKVVLKVLGDAVLPLSFILRERVYQEKVSKSGYFHVLLTKSCQEYYSLRSPLVSPSAMISNPIPSGFNKPNPLLGTLIVYLCAKTK